MCLKDRRKRNDNKKKGKVAIKMKKDTVRNEAMMIYHVCVTYTAPTRVANSRPLRPFSSTAIVSAPQLTST